MARGWNNIFNIRSGAQYAASVCLLPSRTATASSAPSCPFFRSPTGFFPGLPCYFPNVIMERRRCILSRHSSLVMVMSELSDVR